MSDLSKRAFGGLLLLMLILFAALFIPAGTIHYWQAWIFLIVFFISVFAITVYLLRKDPKLLERRVKAGPVAEKTKNQKIIQFFAQFAFLLIIILPAFDYRFGWSNVPAYICFIGDIFVVIGLFIVFLVFKENTFTSAIIAVDKNQKVITTGPYRIVRHPMYSGALIMLCGIPLALGSLWSLLAIIPITIIIITRLLDEESFLAKDLKGYKEYCERTIFHLIPYIW